MCTHIIGRNIQRACVRVALARVRNTLSFLARLWRDREAALTSVYNKQLQADRHSCLPCVCDAISIAAGDFAGVVSALL